MEIKTIKVIFEKEIRRHESEIKRHSEIQEINNSKRQAGKISKHIHKLHQTKLLAKKLGLKFCECCGTIR